MMKTFLKILLPILCLSITSCKEELEKMLETDYKVVMVDYGFDNYMKNIRDKSEPLIIKERNLVVIDVDKTGRTTIENNFIEDSLIVTELKKYITPSPENDKMPITIVKEFQYSGKVNVNKNIIVLAKFDKELDYETYREIRNKIYLSYTIVRNEFSMAKFDKTLEELVDSDESEDNIKWEELKQIFPIRYTETVKEK